MKIIKSLYIIIAWVFTFVPPAYAGSPVWKVVNGDNLLFIGGTIHTLAQSDYPLPASFETAYSQSVQVVLETDIQKLQEPKFQQLMLMELTYSNGLSLKQVLREDTYKALEEHFVSRDIPMANMVHFKPAMVALTLTILELRRLGLFGTGVDEFFSLRASQDHKVLGQLETVEAQLSFISAMGAGKEDEFINYNLREINELPAMMQSIKAAWRQGDLQGLKHIALNPFKNDFPEIYENLLVKRNMAWMPHIKIMLETEDVEFVLVGMLHLVGDDGLLEQLKAQGYLVEML